jgi:AcrR family transcriptional regulator
MVRIYALSDDARAGRDAQRRATRKALLLAAKSLFAEKGFDRTSVTEIGKRAGVSHTLINAYFGGKAGLLAAVVSGTNAVQLQKAQDILTMPGDPVDRLHEILEVCAEFDLEDRRLLSVLHATSWTWDMEAEIANRQERALFTDALAGLIEQGRQTGRLPNTVASAEVAEALFAIYTWGMRRALFEKMTPQDAIAALWPQVVAVLGIRPTGAGDQ